MKKILFFDIDGTLLDSNKQLPESTKYAVKELQKAGHTVAIATGRAPFLFKNIRETLGIDTFIACNGQYVVVDGKVIHKESIAEKDIVELTNHAVDNGHPMVYIDHEDMASNMESHIHVDEGLGSLKFDQDPIHDPNYFVGRDILQALLFCSEGKEQIYEEKFPNLDFLRWHPVSLDVMPKGGTKAESVKRIQQYLDIDGKDIYAFGDGPNDYEMLKLVENSVAMANSVDMTKSVAKLVTDHVDNDGVYKALVKLNLIEEM